MVELTVEEVCALTNNPENIRNLCLIGHNDAQKITLLENLTASAGVTLKDPSQPIPIKTTDKAFYVALNDECLKEVETNSNKFWVNVTDCLGRIVHSTETTATLRISDGCLILTNIMEDFNAHSSTILREAITEQVKPIVIIDNLDTALNANSTQDVFRSLQNRVDAINVIISQHGKDMEVQPEKGTVAFGGKGWFFTLRQFASKLGVKLQKDTATMMEHLWGWHYNPHLQEWSENPTQGAERAFVYFILDPISKLLKGSPEEIKTARNTLGMGEGSALQDNFSAKSVLEMIVLNLPSPTIAQKYRAEVFYDASNDDIHNGIKECNKGADLMIYVARLFQTENRSWRWAAYGRIVGGTLKAAQGIFVNGVRCPKSVKAGLLIGKSIQPLAEISAGNMVFLLGVEGFVVKSATITASSGGPHLRTPRFSTVPVFRRRIELTDDQHMSTVDKALREVCIDEPCLTKDDEDGVLAVAAADESYLEHAVETLKAKVPNISLKVGSVFVIHRETVTREGMNTIARGNDNQQTKVFAIAQPLGNATNAIESGKLSARTDARERKRILTGEFGWKAIDADRVWGFEPSSEGTNILVCQVKDLEKIPRIQQSCETGFAWASRTGPIIEEQLHGVRFNIEDVILGLRGDNQIMPTSRRAMFATFLTSDPSLVQPIMQLEIQGTETTLPYILKTLEESDAEKVTQIQRGKLTIVNAYLPATKSLGLNAKLEPLNTFANVWFDNWRLIPGRLEEEGSELNKTARALRRQKGLNEKLPDPSQYWDRF